MIRFFDILFSGLGLLLGWPILALIALIGWFDTGSPLFFSRACRSLAEAIYSGEIPYYAGGDCTGGYAFGEQ